MEKGCNKNSLNEVDASEIFGYYVRRRRARADEWLVREARTQPSPQTGLHVNNNYSKMEKNSYNTRRNFINACNHRIQR